MKYGWIALALTLAMAVLWGGQISVDVMPLSEGFWNALLGGPELPTTTHFMILLPAAIALCGALVARRVVPTINPRILVGLAIFYGLVIASVLVSDYKFVSAVAAMEWLGYGLVLAAVVALAGRESGPRLLLAVVAGAGFVLALKGIQEYAQMRPVDPTWRIFAGWVNQNALAGMLNLCLFASLGVFATSERLARLGAGLAAAIIGFALFLTQSRGGILSCGLGLAVWLGFGFFWRLGKASVLSLTPLILTGIMIFGLTATAKPKAGGSAMDRFTSASATQEQSAGYRRLLWQSALELAKASPTGTGINTFRFIGSRAGITPPTQLAHSTYLQLAAETSWVGLAAWLGTLALVGRELLRAGRKLPSERNLVRLAVLAAFAASLLHNQIDSLLYHFGLGVILFAMLGIGLQVSADGAGPEFMPKGLRWGGSIVGCGALLVGLFVASRGEILKATALTQMATDRSLGQQTMQAAAEWAPSDGEPFYYLGAMMPPGPERQKLLQQSADLAPTLRTLRALGTLDGLQAALRIDPNNFSALKMLLKTYDRSEQFDQAKQIARRLIAVEDKPYYKIRAIPEMVVTETAEARLYLAKGETDQTTRIRLRTEALEIFRRYREITMPRVRDLAKAGESFAGESFAEAKSKMSTAMEAARALAADQLAAGRAEDGRAAEAEADLFAKAMLD